MKQSLIGLSQRYVTALRNHLKQGPRASMQPALRLGRQAVTRGLETLELARIHERALVTLELSSDKKRLIKRAEIFFTEAITPIEETHRAARQSKIDLNYARQLKKSRQLQEGLRQLTHHVLAAQEDERKRISCELQDEIAQTLTGINVWLATLKKEAALNAKSLDRNIARTQRLVEKSVDIVHRFARELRPAVLDDLGLIPALHSFLKSFAMRTGVRAQLTAFAAVEQLDAARRTVLYRVAQESLTNVARHAQANRVEVCIQKIHRAARMEIKDDGRSFQMDRRLHATGNKRLGLLGMRERVEMIGGTLSVESAPGHGTTVRVDVPFACSWNER